MAQHLEYVEPSTSLLNTVLRSRTINVVARVLLTFVFWSAGLAGVLGFSERVREMSQFGLEPASVYAVVTTIWLIAASAMVIVNRGGELGAAALAVFTVLTIPVAHDFWNMTGEAQMGHFHVVMEHISLLGALLAAAVLCRLARRPA